MKYKVRLETSYGKTLRLCMPEVAFLDENPDASRDDVAELARSANQDTA